MPDNYTMILHYPLHFVLCIKAFQQQSEERARKAELVNEKLQKEFAMMQKHEQKYKVHE